MTNFKAMARRILQAFLGRGLGHLNVKRIQDAEVVSFDVFDTLVIRDCSSPAVVFDIVERRYNEAHPTKTIEGFRQARVQAEKVARAIVPTAEPNIYEVYAVLEDRYRSMTSELLWLEIDTEYSICRPNPEAQRLFSLVRSMGKRIVVASDMYLCYEHIATILSNCGYDGFERLYVSCEKGASKRCGNLFRMIADEMCVSVHDILHIGDHPLADFAVARHEGVGAFLYKRRVRYQGLFTPRFGYRGDALANDVLGAVVANRADGHLSDVRSWMGYAVLGPLLLGYTIWLHGLWESEGYPSLLFLSREGDIMKRTWVTLYDGLGDAQYIHVSRMSLCRAMACMATNYDELFSIFSCLVKGCETVGDFLSLLGVEPSEEELALHNVDPTASMVKVDGHNLYEYITSTHGEWFEEQHALLIEYLNDHIRSAREPNANGKAIVCDIGWSGTMQALLQRVIEDRELIGAYVAVSDFHDKESGSLDRTRLDRRGYWCNSSDWHDDGQVIRFTISALETFFLNREGTVVNYKRIDGSVRPIKEAHACLNNANESIEELHCAAQHFVEDCKKMRMENLFKTINCESAMLPYLNSVVRPTTRTLSFFRCFSFVNGVQAYSLLPEHGLIYYLLHMNEAAYDFDQSNCKALWLRDLLHIPLPYYQLLRFLANGIGLKSTYSRVVEERELVTGSH